MLMVRPRRFHRRPDPGSLSADAPLRCRGYAEAIIAGDDEIATARTIGATYAMDGEGLELCLADLDQVYLAIDADVAPLPVVRATALAWAETTQARYNCMTCADPLTGLSSIHHIQSQVAAFYRAAAAGELNDTDITRSHTLVVLDLPHGRRRDRPGFGELEDALRHAMAAELTRELLPSVAEPALLKPARIVALARRCDGLYQGLSRLTDAVTGRLALSPSGGRAQAWTEALPPTADQARRLLDELAR